MRINERMLEDWICQHPNEAFSNWGPDTTIVERQVSLQHGVADILAWNDTLLIAELKIGQLQEKDIGQLLRYCHDIRTEMQEFCIDLDLQTHGESLMRQDLFYYLYNYLGWGDDQSIQAITPVLIGQSIDEKTLAATEGAGITVLLWNCEEGQFALTVAGALPRWSSRSPWFEHLSTLITQRCQEEAEQDFETVVSGLFGIEATDGTR